MVGWIQRRRRSRQWDEESREEAQREGREDGLEEQEEGPNSG